MGIHISRKITFTGVTKMSKPVIVTETTFQQSGNDLLGDAVAVSGDGNTVAVGAPKASASTGQGAVYIYRRTNGTWAYEGSVEQHMPIGGPNSTAGNTFGTSVALSYDGNKLLASDTSWDFDPNDSDYQTGAVWLYTRTGTSWAYTRGFLQATTGDRFDSDVFGSGIDISSDGTDAVIGEPGDDRGGGAASNFGAIWKFENFEGSETVTKLFDPTGFVGSKSLGTEAALFDNGNFYSTYLSGSGDVEDTKGKIAFYDNTPSAVAGIGNPNGAFADAFGRSISAKKSSSNNQLAAGAPNTDGEGKVYVLEYQASTLSVRDTISRPAEITSTSDFGSSVGHDPASDIIIASTPSHGVAHVLAYNGTSWDVDRSFTAPQSSNKLEVACANGTYVIGARGTGTYNLPSAGQVKIINVE